MSTEWRDSAIVSDVKVAAAFFVYGSSSGHVQIGEWDFASALFSKHPKRLAHDCVVFYFLTLSVAKNQHRCKLVGWGLVRRWRRGLLRSRLARLGAIFAQAINFQPEPVQLPGQLDIPAALVVAAVALNSHRICRLSVCIHRVRIIGEISRVEAAVPAEVPVMGKMIEAHRETQAVMAPKAVMPKTVVTSKASVPAPE